MTPRKIRYVVGELADAMRAGAFGSHRGRDRFALTWALAYAPLVECTLEVRRAARLELVFLNAMAARPRPVAKCSALELAVAPLARILPATSSADVELATSAPANLPPTAAASGDGLNRRG
jgi:hypothetical protein